MASKRQQTMAKMQREQRVREKREQKALKRQAVVDARHARAAEDESIAVAEGAPAEELNLTP
jgi:hypothetical protein